MNCNATREQLENGTSGADESVREHLAGCSECRDYARDLELVSLLRSLPVREPRPGFETRALRTALANAPGRHRTHVAWSLATAASMALAVMITLRLSAPEQPAPAILAEAPDQVFTVTARPLQTRIVDVVLDSRNALENATLTVTLDENLMLENRPQVRELRWQANVQPGGNKLSLPVQLLDAADGEMTVTLEHGDTRQRVTVRVKKEPAGGASPRATI